MSKQKLPQDVSAKVRQRFGSVAARYRSSKVHAAGPDLDMLVAAAPVSADAVILDAGCGAGHTALAFAPLARQVVALDFTRAMLDEAKALARERRISTILPQLGDVGRLPFPAVSFDIVVSRYSAHHWLRPAAALREFRRVLKPSGAFLISDIMAREDSAQDTFLQAIELLRDPSHVRDHSIAQWRALFASAGFRAELLLQFDLTLHFATWTRRMATPKQNAAMIQALFRGASADIRRGFGLPEDISGDDFNFIIPGAVLRGIPR